MIFFCYIMIYWTQKFAGDLMIRNIQLNHAGKYVCIIDTDVESLSVDAVLIVEGNESSCYKHFLRFLNHYYKSCLKSNLASKWRCKDLDI